MGFSIYDFSDFINNIHLFLSETFSPAVGDIIGMVLVASCFLGFIALLGLSLVYVERKICAFFQQRLGPMRVGKWGTAQTVADIIKLIFKEPLMTKDSDKFLFNLAPFIVMIAPVMAISLIPFSEGLQAVDFDIGIFYIVAISSIGVTGILLAGWSSNNKYSLIGAMRSGAQIVSYELSVILSLLTIVVLSGSLQLSVIVESQREGWWIFRGHIPAIIAFIIFIIASTAESNRGPFDMAEAESEITAGFHTEYSGIKFAYFFLAEYVNMFIIAAVGATIFFGGWMPLHIGNIEFFNNAMDLIPPVIWFFMKVSAIIFLLMWFKWTFPRLRIDQMLTLEWKYLLPLNIMNILLMSIVVLTDFHL